MPALGVTGLAEERCPPTQHSRVDRTMRLMAVAAILADGSVVEQHRPAVLGVAFGTDLVRRVAYEQTGGH